MLIRGKCHCGNISFSLTWDPEPTERLYAVVSGNAFENVDPALLKRAPISFDAERADTRLARRRRNWIPDVAIQ